MNERLMAAIAILFLAVGCGETQGSANDGGFDNGTADTNDTTDTGGSDEDTGSETGGDTETGATDTVDSDTEIDTNDPAGSFVGTWGEILVVSINQSGIPILGTLWSSSRNFYLVQISSDGAGHLTATEKLCALKIKVEQTGPIQNESSVPQAFLDHLVPLQRHVTMTQDDPGTAWVSDVVYEVRGANLEHGLCNPADDATCDDLPANHSAEAEDTTACVASGYTGAPKACDQDDDGFAGMTTRLSGAGGAVDCDVYVTQRWWGRLVGEVISANEISGGVTETFSQQTVVAASSAICEGTNPSTAPDNCPAHKYFKMLRLPSGATCADVLALTDCDENEDNCDSNTVLPLDPKNDQPDCP